MEDGPKRPRGRPRGARGARGTRGGRGAARGAASSGASSTPAPEVESTPAPVPDTEMADAPAAEVAASDAPSSNANAAAPPPSADRAAPAEPPRSASPAVRGTSSTRGAARGAARGGRFVPRAIRRSALDREAIARDVQSKLEDQEKQNARLKMRGRGGRGARRARGGPVNFGAVIRGGGGGFGSNIVTATGGRSGGFGSFGAAGGFGSTSGASRSGGGGDSGGLGFTYRKGMKIEDASSQFDATSRATGPRMNTDSFAERVLQQPETDSKEKAIPLPMGIRRVDPEPAEASTALKEDHDEDGTKQEPVPISDESSEIGDVFHNDNEEMTDNGQKWLGASGPKTVKVEDEEFHEIDRLTQRLAMNPAKVRKQKALKNMDWEDRYHAEKMQTQRLLFGIDSDDEDEQEAAANLSESKELTEAKLKRKPLIQDGELYIFQFPPVMPPLHVSQPARDAAAKKSPVKDEPDDDVAMPDAPANKSKGKAIDLTVKDEDEVPEEEVAAGSGSSSKKKSGDSGSRGKMEDQPNGFLGKLNVHKSGKISLDYGGMLFDVEMAIPISHAREAVLIVDEGEKDPDKDGYHGTAYGMGRIAGKFNAVPHWSSVKPWNVDAKELPPWGCDAAPDGTTLKDYAHLLKKEKKQQPPLDV